MNNENKKSGQIRREFLKIGIGAGTALLSGMDKERNCVKQR